MTAAEMVQAELARLDAILAKRGAFYEDEQSRRDAFALCAMWMQDEKDETARIEAEAAAAEEVEREEKRLNDPNFKTKKLFEGVKISIPNKEYRK